MIWQPRVILLFPSHLGLVREALASDVVSYEAEDWLNARSSLRARPYIQLLFVPANQLDDFGLRYLRRIRDRHPALGISAFLGEPALQHLNRVVAAAKLGAVIIHPPELSQKIDQLIHRPRESAADLALEAADIRSPAARALVELFAREPDLATRTSHEIARNIGMSRTALFAKLKDAGLPGLYCVQLLFRALLAWTALRTGRSLVEAAKVAGYVEASGFRRAIESGLGVTAEELEASGWELIVLSWANAVRSSGR